MPRDIVSYINSNDINQVVKKAVNTILRQKPDDPISALAAQLIASANKSYPVFETFEAKKVYLSDSLAHPTL